MSLTSSFGSSGMLGGRLKGPPCKVCGDEASGFHYGVDSCEGCKGFFRRCITQGMTHHCAASETCEITPFSRNSCQFCRLKKCFQVGMSREASRLGRKPKRLKDSQLEHLKISGASKDLTGGSQQSPQFQPDFCMNELQAMVRGDQSFSNGRIHPTPTLPISFNKYLPSSFPTAPKLEPPFLTPPSSVGGGYSAFSPISPLGLLKTEPQFEPKGGSAVSLKFDHHSVPAKFDAFSLSPKFDPLSPSVSGLKLEGSHMFGSPDVDSINSRSSVSGDGRASVGCSSNSSSLDRDVSKSFRHVDIALGGGGTLVPLRESRPVCFPLSSSVDSSSRLNDPAFMHLYDVEEDCKPDIRDAIGFIDRSGKVHYNVPPGMIRFVSPRDRRSVELSADRLRELPRRDRFSIDTPLGGALTRSVTDLSRLTGLDERRHCVLPLPRAEGFNTTACDDDIDILSDTKPDIEKLQEDMRDVEPIEVDQKNLVAGVKRNLPPDEGITEEDGVEQKKSGFEDLPTPQQMREMIKPLYELGIMEVSESRRQLLADTVQEICDSHMSTCNYTVEKILEGLDRYEAICKAQPNGIPPTSEPGQWSFAFIQNMVPVIKRVVCFSKRLPAFKNLSQSDQIRLIQQNSFEVILVRYTKLFTSTGLFTPDMTEKIPRRKVKQMPNLGEFFMEQYLFADEFNKLKLTDEELGLLTGIMIVRPEPDTLENEKGVTVIRQLFLQALYYKMKELRPDNHKEHFEKALSVLPYATFINTIHSQKMEKMKANPHFKDKGLDLHDEVFAS